jgi:hypothetical protein
LRITYIYILYILYVDIVYINKHYAMKYGIVAPSEFNVDGQLHAQATLASRISTEQEAGLGGRSVDIVRLRTQATEFSFRRLGETIWTLWKR